MSRSLPIASPAFPGEALPAAINALPLHTFWQ